MSRLRVIAVEKVYISDWDSTETCIACVYDDNSLAVYDTFGEVYQQKEYFGDFDSLNYLISKGKYEWADFYIYKGDMITRDYMGNLLVNGKKLEGLITPIKRDVNYISDISIKLYYNFLCKLHNNDPQVVLQLNQSFDSGEFKKDILSTIQENPTEELTTDDKELIVRCRLDGYNFVSKKFKEIISSEDPYKVDEITYYFTRLFKLQYQNYIVL